MANLTLIYELPVGKGKVLPLKQPVLDAVAGGWQISAIVTVRSGMPLTPIEANSAQTNVGRGVTPRPDLVGSVAISDPTRYEWFNTGAFANRTYITMAEPGEISCGGQPRIPRTSRCLRISS